MKGLIEFFYLLLIAIALFIVWMIYRFIKQSLDKRKYSNLIAQCKRFGYNYICAYKGKGKGFIYGKQVALKSFEELLAIYDFNLPNINTKYQIWEYYAIIKYPEWSEHIPGVEYIHGGDRLCHFYSMIVFLNGKLLQRPFSCYLNDEVSGELLAPIDLENAELLELFFSDADVRYPIERFDFTDIEYWTYRLRDIPTASIENMSSKL